MKYIINRASEMMFAKTPPCECAYLDKHLNIQVLYVSESKYNNRKHVKVKWRDVGTNHTETINQEGRTVITRRLPDIEEYTIDINNLHELNDLAREEGDIIISNSSKYKESPTITIYDDYIE
ncbi:MAG: hypothetical protein GY861_05415 [bacterium]|nr:hypothetical protein [bacterium]